LVLASWLNIVGKEQESKALLKEAIHIGSITATKDTNIQAGLASELLADNLKRAGRLTEAQAAYRRAIELGLLNGEDRGSEIAAHASLHLGMLIEQTHAFPDAQPDYQTALNISKKVTTQKTLQYGSVAALLLGTGFAERGQAEVAKSMFEEAIRLGDTSGTPEGTNVANQAREYLTE
jgi:tetratricopeptide (TPR) repeat protein